MTADLTEVVKSLVRDVVREEIRAALRDLQLGGVEQPVPYAAAAKFAGCSKTTIGEWVGNGLLPATGKGRLRRVKLSDVAKALERLRVVRIAPAGSQTSAAEQRAVEILAGSNVRRIR